VGILAEPLEMLREVIAVLPQDYSVCELGDQYITCGERRLASEFYKELGCKQYESIDGNGRGTVIADLNRPLPKFLSWNFDLVTDFGTGEHIFDQRQVFKSIHIMIKRGGYFVFDRPCKGYVGHCYWLTDECVWRDFASTNGYTIIKLEKKETTRGELIRGIMRKNSKGKFLMPQQGRYHKILKGIMK